MNFCFILMVLVDSQCAKTAALSICYLIVFFSHSDYSTMSMISCRSKYKLKYRLRIESRVERNWSDFNLREAC
jgi:hypothetical protein